MVIRFPILGMKDGNSRFYAVEKKDFGFVSKGHGKFYNGLKLIDSEGDFYRVTSWSVKGKSGILKSIMNLQILEELNVNLELLERRSFSEFKEDVLGHIQKHPKTFAPLYDGSPWSERINKFDTFDSLIRFFK